MTATTGVTAADILLSELTGCGLDVCFANPGTSEMHIVAAMDRIPMRAVPTLFEGVATGASDGYARITGRPAAALLHLGPGLGNGLANLHNARRAATPMVVIVGDHATYHKRYDPPLESDIDAVARTVSGWVRRCRSVDELGHDARAAVAAAAGRPGQIATLILPADLTWSPANDIADIRTAHHVALAGIPSASAIDRAVAVLRSEEPTVLLIGGDATGEAGLTAAANIAAATGARLLCETFPALLARGHGRPGVQRLAYLAEGAAAQLAGAHHLLLAGTCSPVAFFAYPGLPSDLVPTDCHVHELAGPHTAAATLTELADAVAGGSAWAPHPHQRTSLPTGPLTAAAIAAAVGALLPEGAIVVDEANTGGLPLADATADSPPHDWMSLTGGAIGYGLPAAVGAAVAAPDRPVLCLQADGSAMYTLSALWTQARENLNVTTVIYNNGAYDILRMELLRTNAGRAEGPTANSLVDLTKPRLDFVALAAGMGVPARQVSTAEEFVHALRAAFEEPGPHLIDAIIPPLFGAS
ncbi:acetolactate synthase large subunit [Mycolicibacterium porcinum]